MTETEEWVPRLRRWVPFSAFATPQLAAATIAFLAQWGIKIRVRRMTKPGRAASPEQRRDQ